MKKFFEIPQLAIERFERENIVTTSIGSSSYSQDVSEFRLSPDSNNLTKVIQWTF